MQIDPNLLTEDKYTNPRLVKIKNKKIGDLYEKIKEHQEKVNPFLKRYEEIEAKKAELKKPFDEYVAEVKQELEDIVDFAQKEDQKAAKVKEKLIPLVEDELLPQMSELDEFVGIEKKDDGYYAKVNDRIEEWVKTVRLQKPKE